MQLVKTLNFLKKLRKNNNKEWFDANRSTYEEVKSEIKALVVKTIDAIAVFDPSIAALEPKDCVFRINRDIRFSKDKTPYKTSLGCIVAPGGKKSIKSCYYIHIEPDNCFIAGGIHMPQPDQLKMIRQEIDYSGDQLNALFKSKSFSKYFKTFDQELKLIRIPKGYDDMHAHADLLKLKSFTVTLPIDETVFTKGDIIKTAIPAFKELLKLNTFLNTAIDS